VTGITNITVSPPTLHMFQLSSQPHIRSIKMRRRSPKCFACGDEPGLTRDLQAVGYDAFCAGPQVVSIEDDLRISVRELKTALESGDAVHLLDTRSPTEFDICAIPKSISEYHTECADMQIGRWLLCLLIPMLYLMRVMCWWCVEEETTRKWRCKLYEPQVSTPGMCGAV
jgi:hypothetical protein